MFIELKYVKRTENLELHRTTSKDVALHSSEEYAYITVKDFDVEFLNEKNLIINIANRYDKHNQCVIRSIDSFPQNEETYKYNVKQLLNANK